MSVTGGSVSVRHPAQHRSLKRPGPLSPQAYLATTTRILRQLAADHRSVAMILRNTLRSQDVAGRYGGEEFAVLLPGADAERAAQVAEGARRTVGSSVLEKSASLRGTVSIGVAQLDARDTDYRDWIAHADQALHAAKSQGGNRTVRRESLAWSPQPG